MERYSRLCQTGGPSGGTRELVKSVELDTFLRQEGIMNLQAGYDAVVQTLSGFRRLSQSDDLPPEQRPMLIRYSPIELAGQPGWAKDVMPFLALCATGTDGRGQLRHHTYFFRPGLLRRAGVFHYLDHLFGSRFAVASDEDADPDLPPLRVEPAVRPEDAPLVKLTAAAVLKKRCILLKLEKDCNFNRRALDLLAQIYALLPPELAIQTGFSSYQDPSQLEKLMRTTPIRIFLTHADCSCSASDPGYLYFDLNQPLNLQLAAQQSKDFQVSKALLTYLTYWHSMPWWERQPLMELLFAEEKHLPNEQSYCAITGSFVREPFIQWINRIPDRGSIASLEELKEKYDSFPICERIPVLRKKFRMAVPSLLKPPATLEALSRDAARRLSKAPEEEQEQFKALSDFAQMLLSIRLEEPRPAAAPRKPDREDQSEELRELREKLAELTEENRALQKNHAQQLHKVESELQEYIDLLSRENETLKSSLSGQTDTQEELARLRQAQTKLEQDLSWQLHETEQAYQAKLTQLRSEHEAALKRAAEGMVPGKELADAQEELARLRQTQTKLEQDLSWQLHETEQAYQAKLTQLRSEHEAALKDQAAALAEQELRHAEELQKRNADHQTALEQQLQVLHNRHSDEIEQIHAAYARQLKTLEQNFQNQRSSEIEQLRIIHDKQMEKLELEHAADLNRLRQEHTEYTKQLRTEAESAEAKNLMLTNKLAQLARERDDARTQAEQALRAEFDETLSAELQALEQRHAETLAQQKAGVQESEKALTAQLEARHAQELAQLEARHQTEQKQLREELEQTARDLDTANQKHQQFKADMKQQFNKKCEEIHAAAQERIQQLEKELAAAKSVTVADPNAEQRLRDAVEAERARYRQLETKMQATVRETEAAFLQDREQLTRDHEWECAGLRSQVEALEQKLRTAPSADQAAAQKFRSDIEKINENNAKARQELEQKFRSDIEQINNNNTKARQALEQKHKSEIEQINATNARLRQELQEQHAAEKKQLQKQVMKTVSEQWEKLNEANRTIWDLQQQLENASQPQSEGPSSGTRTPWWKR